MNKKKTRSLSDLFEKNELNISRLYKIYSQKTNEKKFWESLAKEEIIHATEIKEAFTGIELKESKFTRGALNYVINFIEEEIEKANNNKISHLDAIKTALRIERSILEKKCFDFFAPTEITIKDIMLKMNTETDGHINLLMKELEKVNK